jgi:homoserine dehydrogenase
VVRIRGSDCPRGAPRGLDRIAKIGQKALLLSACHKAKQRGIDLAGFAWVRRVRGFWRRSLRIDLFVELIGGEEGTALSAAEAALGSGKSFVTANNALLAKHGMRLAALAEEKGVALNYVLTRMESEGSDLRAMGAKARPPRDLHRQTDCQTG